jgi:hypothetical protein
MSSKRKSTKRMSPKRKSPKRMSPKRNSYKMRNEKEISAYFLWNKQWIKERLVPSNYNNFLFLKKDISDFYRVCIDNPEYSNYYMLCIKYQRGDTQIGISGTGKIYENPYETALRELQEETSFKLKLEHFGNTIENGKNWNTFFVEVFSTTRLYRANLIQNIDPDDRSKKCWIYVVGDFETMANKFRTLFNSTASTLKDDGIDTIALVKIQDIYETMLIKT